MPNGLSAIGITSRQWAAWVLLLKPLQQLTPEDFAIIEAEHDWLINMMQRATRLYPDAYNTQYESFKTARSMVLPAR